MSADPSASTDSASAAGVPFDSSGSSEPPSSSGRPFDPSRLARKHTIDPSTFFQVDMRVGRVVAVEDFPSARKPAWKLQVNFGPLIGELWTSAQVRNYTRDDLVNRLVVGAVNLGSKRIAGFKSEFLVLGALEPDGTVRLLSVPDDVPLGAPIA